MCKDRSLSSGNLEARPPMRFHSASRARPESHSATWMRHTAGNVAVHSPDTFKSAHLSTMKGSIVIILVLAALALEAKAGLEVTVV